MSQNFIQIPNDIFSLNLTSLQFRTLCNFIRISGFNKGHSFFGYEKLAAMNNCKKNAMIKTVKELCEMGFIQKIERANYSKSNDILLTIEKGVSRCKNGGFCNEQGEGYLKDTPNPKKGYLKDTEGYLKDTEEYLKDTPNNRLTDLNNLNLNNKKNEGYLKDTPNRAAKDFEEEKAAGDAAPAQSMPNAGQAGENSQQGSSARFSLDDLNDCQCCIENIDGAKEFSFFYGNGQLTFRPAWKLAKYNETSINAVIEFFKEKCGKEIRFLEAAHCVHEQKIV